MNVIIIVLVIGVLSAFWLLKRPRYRASSRAEKDVPPPIGSVSEKLVAIPVEVARTLPPFDGSEPSPKEPDAEGDPRKAVSANTGTRVGETVEHVTDNSVQEHPQVNVPSPPSGALVPPDEENNEAGQIGAPLANCAGVLFDSRLTEEPLPCDTPELPKAGVDHEENVERYKTAILEQDEELEPAVSFSETPIPSIEAAADGTSDATTKAEELRAQNAEDRNAEQAEMVPVRYRPPRQRPPRQSGLAGGEKKTRGTGLAQSAAMEIRVRLTFDRFGFASLGFLPERVPDLDEEIEVTDGKAHLQMVAQENWYQDLQFPDAGERMSHGIELRGLLSDHRLLRWRLSGRDIYVLAGHPLANGFVSAPRLLLGRTDVVLCTDVLASEVETVLGEAGCRGYSKFGEAQGLPAGWTGFRGVRPAKAIALELGSDPFYAVKPAPDIQIELEGGVCVRNSVWLAGYPPRIKLFGETQVAVKVLIDGKESQKTSEGCLTASGYDLAGEHSVYCAGLSCSRAYSIEEPEESWDSWAAYSFSEADICGPLVQVKEHATHKVPISVPMSNPLLIGCEAGQVFQCSSRKAANWKGFVPFQVAWALPAQPLTCDKKTARILQFSAARPVLPERPAKSESRWCNAILDAARKGLRIDNGSGDSSACWAAYKKVAQNIRRGRR